MQHLLEHWDTASSYLVFLSCSDVTLSILLLLHRLHNNLVSGSSWLGKCFRVTVVIKSIPWLLNFLSGNSIFFFFLLKTKFYFVLKTSQFHYVVTRMPYCKRLQSLLIIFTIYFHLHIKNAGGGLWLLCYEQFPI